MRDETVRRRAPKPESAGAAAAPGGSGFTLSWLFASVLLLLATVLLGTGSIAWAELRRPAAGAPLDPARYDIMLDVPRAPAKRVVFGIGSPQLLPPAVLRIPRLQIEVAVDRGTDSPSVVRGAGLIAGSAAPGSSGHVGLALRRDRRFGRLRELSLGDIIALDTADSTQHYQVTRLALGPEADAALLGASAGAALTLAAAQAFDASSRAPRFIIRAELVAPQRIAAPASP